jgi:hypothetical protein
LGALIVFFVVEDMGQTIPAVAIHRVELDLMVLAMGYRLVEILFGGFFIAGQEFASLALQVKQKRLLFFCVLCMMNMKILCFSSNSSI